MKRRANTPAIILIFPDIFKTVAIALRTYMPGPLNDEMQTILGKMALCETERLVSLPAKHDFGPILTAILESTDRYVPMRISFHDPESTLDEFERMEANDALIDASIEEAVRLFCTRLRLPYQRKE